VLYSGACEGGPPRRWLMWDGRKRGGGVDGALMGRRCAEAMGRVTLQSGMGCEPRESASKPASRPPPWIRACLPACSYAPPSLYTRTGHHGAVALWQPSLVRPPKLGVTCSEGIFSLLSPFFLYPAG
jgi:hypothetical protein